MDAHEKSTMANVVGWLALILSIIALALAWTAFDRASEENLGEMIQNQVQETLPMNQQTQPDTNSGGLNDTNSDPVPGSTNGTVNDGTTDDGTVITPENTQQ